MKVERRVGKSVSKTLIALAVMAVLSKQWIENSLQQVLGSQVENVLLLLLGLFLILTFTIAKIRMRASKNDGEHTK
jgi:hypothetical protein